MKWQYLSLKETCPLPCSVCGKLLPDESIPNGDILYFPDFRGDSDGWQAARIERIWQVDPYADFNVCEACVAGHCGAVRGLTADTWLAKKSQDFERRQNES